MPNPRSPKAMQIYRNESSLPLHNAQRNLAGRTHYVDTETLRFHKSRVVSARAGTDGLYFWIVTSDALDSNNTRRGFRYVVFDVFGTVVSRHALEDARRTSAQALKDMWKWLETFDAVDHTREALGRWRTSQAREADEFETRYLKAKEAA